LKINVFIYMYIYVTGNYQAKILNEFYEANEQLYAIIN